jgi:hypothetical protein
LKLLTGASSDAAKAEQWKISKRAKTKTKIDGDGIGTIIQAKNKPTCQHKI